MGLGRGVIFGAIWGLLAAALLLVVVSLAAPPPQGVALAPEAVPDAPAAAPETSTDLAPTLAAPQAAEDGPALPEPMPAAPDLPPGLAAAPQAPGGVGEAPAQAVPLDPTGDAPAVPDVTATGTAPPVQSDEIAAVSGAPSAETPAEAASEPSAPADAAVPGAKTADTPAEPSAPVASLIPTPYGSEFAREAPDVSPALPATEAAPAATPAPRPAEAAPDLPTTSGLDAAPAPQPSASAAPAEPTAPASPPQTSGAVASAPVPARPEASAPGLVQPLPQRGAEPALPLGASETPVPEVAAVDPAPAPPLGPAADAEPAPTAKPAAPEQSAEPAPAVVPPGPAPQPGFRQAPGIKVNQLPRIGDVALPGPLPGAEPPAEPRAELAPETLPALVAHAAAFNAAPDAPLLSIVLIDDRSGPDAGPGIAADLLADLPFPVTIALDPAAPGAAEAARAYRAAGQEVAILAALPRGATPSDLEVSWQAFVQALPEAVAVLDAPDARLQNDRRLAEQLIVLAAEAGHGLLTWDIGLNPAAQLAAAASVPQAQVFRRLDAEQESAPVIGRYLDRAAFEAARSGAVVVTASTRPETLAALLDWAVSQSRPVTLAPLSAVLMRDF